LPLLDSQKKPDLSQEKRNKQKISKLGRNILIGITTGVIIVAVILSILLVPLLQYNKALNLSKEYQFDEAISIFEKLGNYKNSLDLKLAMTQYKDGNFKDAKRLFDGISKETDVNREIEQLIALIGIQGTWEDISASQNYIFVGWRYFVVDNPK